MADTPVRVGLVGAGAWAELAHGPMLAAGPETSLTGVWSRRSERAQALAASLGATAFATYDDLLAECDAVAFAVPPAVQAELAPHAARRGKALLLEKPLADTLRDAEALAQAIAEAGVPSLVAFSYRYSPKVREFLAQAHELDWSGGRASFFSSTYLGGRFRHGWKLGSLLEVGPHVIDLLDAALGAVEAVGAAQRGDWTDLVLQHASGARSTVTLCCDVAVDRQRVDIELLSAERVAKLDLMSAVGAHQVIAAADGQAGVAATDTFATLRSEFATAVRTNGGHPLDAARGLRVQRIIAAAERYLRDAKPSVAVPTVRGSN
jgi:predicted dehydrogenase